MVSQPTVFKDYAALKQAIHKTLMTVHDCYDFTKLAGVRTFFDYVFRPLWNCQFVSTDILAHNLAINNGHEGDLRLVAVSVQTDQQQFFLNIWPGVAEEYFDNQVQLFSATASVHSPSRDSAYHMLDFWSVLKSVSQDIAQEAYHLRKEFSTNAIQKAQFEAASVLYRLSEQMTALFAEIIKGLEALRKQAIEPMQLRYGVLMSLCTFYGQAYEEEQLNRKYSSMFHEHYAKNIYSCKIDDIEYNVVCKQVFDQTDDSLFCEYWITPGFTLAPVHLFAGDDVRHAVLAEGKYLTHYNAKSSLAATRFGLQMFSNFVLQEVTP